MDRSTEQDTLTQGLESVVQALQSEDTELAQKLLAAILLAHPGQPDALQFLGIVHHRQGDTGRAEALMRQALAAAPGEAGIMLNLGNVLYESGRAADAVEAFGHAIEIDPSSSPAWHNLGTALHGQGNLAEARFAWERAVAADATNADAWYGLSRTLIELGDVHAGLVANSRAIALWPRRLQARDQVVRALVLLGELDEAARLYCEWLAEDPDNVVIHHQLAALGHEAIPDRAADAYVEAVFDSFAPHFDSKLEKLGYQAPMHVARALGNALPAGAQVDIADLGCGTGLCGPHLRRHARRLIGCDLSTGMLRLARERGCYDELYKVELVHFLNHEPASFSAIACADTLCYFGPLDAVCRSAISALKSLGCFVFTTEALPEEALDGYQIRPTGRYAHGREYLIRTLCAAGFVGVEIEGVVLRQEAGQPMAGWLVTAN
ncbi:MAG: tetratricopeptide repeat protein [Burkholderiales bacterium]